MPCSFQSLEYSEPYHIMTLTRALFVAVAVVVSASPSFADARSDAKSQVDFGISVAQRGLWREAIYRWEKAAEIDPTYAAAFNDLAIAIRTAVLRDGTAYESEYPIAWPDGSTHWIGVRGQCIYDRTEPRCAWSA